MKSYQSISLNISWQDLVARIEPNNVTLYLRDDNNFTVGWNFYDQLELKDEINFNSIDQFIEKHKCEFIFTSFAYDLKNHVEPKLFSNNKDFLDFPLVDLKCPSNIIHSINGNLIYFGELSEIELNRLFNVGIAQSPLEKESIELIQIESEEEYREKVKLIKGHIQRGDIYETNFCTGFVGQYSNLNPINAFEKLYKSTESPFSVYSRIDNKIILSSSPERFLQKENQLLSSQPIKGTARKGKSEKENKLIVSNLKNDPKEISENVMIVDLVRNDLSKIAVKNSVKVDALVDVYAFKNINQLISTISCNIQNELQFSEILKSLFPMGSMTGAPKHSAMSISENLESFKRNLYSGSIGLIMPNGNFDMNVVIRTTFIDELKNSLFIGVGGAITINSDPAKEYEECLEKIKSISQVFC